MTRRLLSLLTALSLLLCVAVVTLWVASYRTRPTLQWGALEFITYEGELYLWNEHRADYAWREFPLWLVLLLAGTFPVARAGRSVRRCILAGERMALGRCGHCGYDLRATSGVYPECGGGRGVA